MRTNSYLCLLLYVLLLSPLSSPSAYAQISNELLTSQGKQAQAIPMADIQRFVRVIAQIKHFYIHPVPYDTLFNNAIRGMLIELDPHSSLLDKKAIKALNTVTTGEFSGLGVEILPEKGIIRVISPIDGTPAQKVGIKPGDIILRINGQLVKEMTTDEAIAKMRGKQGSTVVLTILREGKQKPIDISIIRDIIKIKTVKSRLLEQGYGYIRIGFFHAPTVKELKKAIKKIKIQNKTPLKGVIIDLRSNPGGLLKSAIDVSNIFLDYPQHRYHNLIVYTKGRTNSHKIYGKITKGDLLKNTHLVVLINGGSASAAEIVAGALQDYKRAVILGTKSFGKGSVQTVLPINKDMAIKLTTALYYTPSGRSIQADGIEPDVNVPYLTLSGYTDGEQNQAFTFPEIKEANLEGHLKGNERKTNTKHSKSKNPRQTAKDFQLFIALKLLKGLYTMKH